MPGDYTRFTHRPAQGYNSVLMQQGRVQLDSDWNEQADILQRRLRVQALDTFGPCAVPEPTTPDAFKLTALVGPPADLAIGGGRLYLDGLLAEIFAGEGFSYLSQKYYPDPPALPLSGEAIAYLDLWEREVTSIEDPELLEKALGGPDTTTRRQTVWQVKWHALADATCGIDLNALFPPSAGRLTTTAIAPPASNDPCILSPSGGYRGLENRLYRVEVHRPGALGTARFKWSRDNASIVSRVDDLAVSGTQTRLTVARIGRDKVLRFSVGDWVEVTDDYRELMGESGEMAQVTDTNEAALTLTLDRTLPTSTGRAFGASATEIKARHTRVRKWDQQSPGNSLGTDGLMTASGANLHLEDGVFVQLGLNPATGEFKVGDYWVFATRTADASVEPLTGAPPRGIEHHYCPLATLQWVGTPAVLDLHDCRTLWPDPHCCMVSVRPGEDIQGAIDSLPPEGGCVCLLPGIHEVQTPILIDTRKNILIEGIGRASKLVSNPAVSGGALFYIAGGSHWIRLRDLLLFADDRPSLVTLAEDAREIDLVGLTLLASAPTNPSCCVLLAGCAEVTLEGSTLVGPTGVLQAGPEQVAAVATALAALRPPPITDDTDNPNDVASEATSTPEAPPLRGLWIDGNELFVVEAGVDLRNALGGRLRENGVTGLGIEDLNPLRRTADANATADLAPWLDDALTQLRPVAGIDQLTGQTTAVRACLLEGFDITGNRLAADRGIGVVFSREVSATGNQILAARCGVHLGYAFDCGLGRNRIDLPPEKNPPAPADSLAGVLKDRGDPGRLAVAFRFARGLEIEANRIEAPSAIGTLPGTLGTSCAKDYPESLLRLLRIGRPWHLVLELAWLLLVILRALMVATGSTKPFAPGIQTKADLGTRLFQGLLHLLGKTAYLPAFVGKARIADNLLEIARYGVFLNQILSLGGLRIEGNRISGFSRTGILVYPLFAVGLVDRFAAWVQCGFQWLIAVLRLLRDRLGQMLGGEPVAEPKEPADLSAGTLAISGVSWLVYFCSRFCPGGQPPGGTGPNAEPESPAQDLKDALDDLLDHLNPTWLTDLVNQSYRIEGNTLRGSGDGIFSGVDGSQILGNQLSIELSDTLAFETLVLGRGLQRQFTNTLYLDSFLFGSLMELDRDWLLLALSQGSWVDTHLNQADFRTRLLNAVQEVGTLASPASPLSPHLVAIRDALVAGTPDLDRVRQEWPQLLLKVWSGLRGYGIVMMGADMVCAENRVCALRGCAPVTPRTGFGNQDSTGPSGLSGLLALPGVLPAAPALGGIWQFTNLVGWMLDLVSLTMGERSDLSGRYAGYFWALVTYLALSGARDRRLEVAHNGVEEALAFGIRTQSLGGMGELDVTDNRVRDAVRYGICHRDLAAGQRDDAGLHAKVRGNSVVRTNRVFQPPTLAAATGAGAAQNDFAALIWLENRLGRSLVSSNHGDGLQLSGERRAVCLVTGVAGVTDNHVDSTSQFAFEVSAGQGLFSSNMTHPGNAVSPGLRQPPNVENL